MANLPYTFCATWREFFKHCPKEIRFGWFPENFAVCRRRSVRFVHCKRRFIVPGGLTFWENLRIWFGWVKLSRTVCYGGGGATPLKFNQVSVASASITSTNVTGVKLLILTQNNYLIVYCLYYFRTVSDSRWNAKGQVAVKNRLLKYYP